MSRIDTIGHNGGDGAHYDDPLYWRKRAENAEGEVQEVWDLVGMLVAAAGGSVRVPVSIMTDPPTSLTRADCEKTGSVLFVTSGGAAPVPPPDVRELVELAFREGFDFGEVAGSESPVIKDPLAEEKAWSESKARAALAKFRGQP